MSEICFDSILFDTRNFLQFGKNKVKNSTIFLISFESNLLIFAYRIFHIILFVLKIIFLKLIFFKLSKDGLCVSECYIRLMKCHAIIAFSSFIVQNSLNSLFWGCFIENFTTFRLGADPITTYCFLLCFQQEMNNKK